jgi:hypothetical protein
MLRKIASLMMFSAAILMVTLVMASAQGTTSAPKAPDSSSKVPAKVIEKAPVKTPEAVTNKASEVTAKAPVKTPEAATNKANEVTAKAPVKVTEQAVKAVPPKMVETEKQVTTRPMETSSEEWAKIEDHYKMMMEISDPTKLKEELKLHQEMMTEYRNKLMAHQEMRPKIKEASVKPKPAVMPPKSEGAKKEGMPAGH